uniref:Uncharacterized protein n=1 Tax=viral metagenome TaxID=1070528 RepID=A0A6C0DTS5_9ZZZZ
MSNIFKTEQKPNNRNNDRNYLSNSFRSNSQPVVQKFEIKEADFPELIVEEQSKNKSKISNENENVMQYKNAILKSDDEDAVKYNLTPGWVNIYYDKNRKLVIEKHDARNEVDEDFHTSAQRVFQKLIDKRETERITYNNLYGEGEYERIYYIPRREDDKYYEYNTDEDTESVEEANKDEYSEDNPEYYDLY